MNMKLFEQRLREVAKEAGLELHSFDMQLVGPRVPWSMDGPHLLTTAQPVQITLRLNGVTDMKIVLTDRQ